MLIHPGQKLFQMFLLNADDIEYDVHVYCSGGNSGEGLRLRLACS